MTTDLATLANAVFDLLDKHEVSLSAIESLLRKTATARKRKDRILRVHAECIRVGLKCRSLPVTRVGLFSAVSEQLHIFLSADAVESAYYLAISKYGATSVLSERINPKNLR